MIITILGLANVGKTSIIHRTLLSKSVEDLDVRPTIFKEHTQVQPSWIEDKVNIIDLGGQQSYLKVHANHENFVHTKIVIFVVDVQDVHPERLEQTKLYFRQITEVINELSTKPEVGYFIHKYDPDRKVNLEKNTSQYLKICKNVLQDLNPTVYLTSIYDNSLYQSLITLMMRVSYDQAIILGLSKVDPDTWNLNEMTNKNQTHQKLFDLGNNLGVKIRNMWIELALSGESISQVSKKINFEINAENSKSYKLQIKNADKLPYNDFLSAFDCFEIFFKAFIHHLVVSSDFKIKENILEIKLKLKN